MIKPIKQIKDVFVSKQSRKTKLQKVNQPTMYKWIINRLKEKSTWRGIIGFVSVAGISFSPELTTQIVITGVALASLAEVIFKEAQSEDA